MSDMESQHQSEIKEESYFSGLPYEDQMRFTLATAKALGEDRIISHRNPRRLSLYIGAALGLAIAALMSFGSSLPGPVIFMLAVSATVMSICFMMALWFWRDLSRKVDTIRTLYENVPQSPAIDILAALRASLAEMKAEKPMKKERQP